MRHVVIGAGAVGGSIGAGFSEVGADVVLVAGGEHYATLRDRGLSFTVPGSPRVLAVPVVEGPENL